MAYLTLALVDNVRYDFSADFPKLWGMNHLHHENSIEDIRREHRKRKASTAQNVARVDTRFISCWQVTKHSQSSFRFFSSLSKAYTKEGRRQAFAQLSEPPDTHACTTLHRDATTFFQHILVFDACHLSQLKQVRPSDKHI